MSELELSTTKFLQMAEQERQQQDEHGGPEEPPRGVQGPQRSRKWTWGLTVVCVLFLIIGAMGAFSGIMGLTGLMIEPEVPTIKYSGDAATYRMEMQTKTMIEEQIMAQRKYFWVLLYMELMKLGISVFMVLSAALMFQRMPRGRSIGVNICGFAIFFHICLLVVTFLLMSESAHTFRGFMDSAVDRSAADARAQGADVSQEEIEAAKSTMMGVLQMGMIIGFSLMIILKAVFYSSIIIYLSRPHIKEIFGEDSLKEYRQVPGAAAAANAG